MTVTPPTTLPLELPQSTPIKINSATTLPFTTNQKYRIESCSTMASEMRKYLVGPMPPQQFLNDFFPLNELSCLSKKSDLPSFSPGCYHRTVIAESEKKAYNPFVSELLQCCFISTNYFSRSNQRRISCLGSQLSIRPILLIAILDWIFPSR
jgi:hypothetical protein